jgi:hypothetical protein
LLVSHFDDGFTNRAGQRDAGALAAALQHLEMAAIHG